MAATVFRMLSSTSFSAFSSAVPTSPAGAASAIRPVAAQNPGGVGSQARAGTLATAAPKIPTDLSTMPGKTLPRGSLLDLSV